jgi:GTP cyclohydrolase I
MSEQENWQEVLKHGVELYLKQTTGKLYDPVHMKDTPIRMVRAFSEYASGYLEDPRAPLQQQFKGAYDQMVHRRRIRVLSRCAHHMEPILGIAHFAYLPNFAIVGLSKIPRFIRILSRRLQVQEALGEQIVDVFQEEVKPLGCAVRIKAYHFCEITRGVREDSAFTETTALRGVFKTDPSTKAEFIASIDYSESIF